MENPGSVEEKKIKDIRNPFRLKKEIQGIKDRMLRDIKNLFEYEKEEKSYHKPVRLNDFWSNNYIEYKSDDEKNKILSVQEYLNKIRPYLKDIINILKKSDTWKIHLTVTIDFASSEDDNDEECVMYSKSGNTEIMISDEED